MIINIIAQSIYETGKRENQEDSIFPPYSGKPSKGDLFILCDGMGGHESGEVASQAVCEAMSYFISKNPRKDGFFGEEDFDAALDAAYDALDARDSDSERKMGTTLTFVKFHRGGCFVAHIGDSRVYQVRPLTKQIMFVTKDHSLVNDLISLGELTPEEARHSKQKNIITRAMQPHQERRVKADCVNLTDIEAGDYFYICSDGMLENSEDGEIMNILSMNRTDAEKIEILRGATRENCDNHSAHLIRIISIATDESAIVEPFASESDETGESQTGPSLKESQESQKKKIMRTWLFLLIAVIGIVYSFALLYRELCN